LAGRLGSGGSSTKFLYEYGATNLIDLNQLPAGKRALVRVSSVIGMNNKGQVVGTALNQTEISRAPCSRLTSPAHWTKSVMRLTDASGMRKRDIYDTTLAVVLAPHGHVGPMLVGDLAHDGKAESGPGDRIRRRAMAGTAKPDGRDCAC